MLCDAAQGAKVIIDVARSDDVFADINALTYAKATNLFPISMVYLLWHNFYLCCVGQGTLVSIDLDIFASTCC